MGNVSGWVYDSEIGDYITLEEYLKKQLDKEKRKKLEEFVELMREALTKKIRLKIDIKTGEMIIEER